MKKLEVFVKIFNTFFKSSPKSIISIIIINFITGLIPAAITVLWKYFFEAVFNIKTDSSNINLLILLFVGLSSAIAAQKILQTFTFVQTSKALQNTKINLLKYIHQAVNKTSVEEYENHEFYNIYDRAYDIINNDNLIYLIRRIIYIFQAVITVISTTIILASFSWILLPICILSILPPTIAKIIRGKKYYYMKYHQTPKIRLASYYFSLIMNRNSNRELYIYDSFSYIEDKWKKTITELHRESFKFYLKQGFIQFFVDASRILGLCIGIVVAFVLALNHIMGIGSLGAAISAIQSVQDSFTSILVALGNINNNFYELNDLLKILENQDNNAHKKTFDELNDKITLKNLHYKYPKSESYVLKKINLEINKNEKIAIVGLNGAGKSTLVKLILGIYKPSEGSVSYDGKELSNINTEQVYRKISAVFQDFLKYKLLLRENVAISKIENLYNDHLIDSSLTNAGLAERPDLDAKLGREFGGIELSGGQWQKIAIARSIFKNSSMVIFDEPTSALDPLIEYDILSKIQKISKDSTLIFITHRIGSAQLADRIVVLKDGEIIENGSHLELMQENGEYFRLFSTQAELYKIN